MAPFAGWEMPIHYGSQIEEHHRVRTAVGLFDVSHMAVVDLQGRDSTAFLQRLLANDVGRLVEDGSALYSCMLNEQGGVIDDLIVYRRATHRFRLVLNAATAGSDLDWIAEQSKDYTLEIQRRPEMAILALQGPAATTALIDAIGDRSELTDLKRFRSTEFDQLFVARTGYTGEEGYELILPVEDALPLWDRLLTGVVTPVGLGARDTLRLEAGLCLYGRDLDNQHTPTESGIDWTVAWQPEGRDFIGRQALSEKNRQTRSLFTGLLLEEKGVLRSGMSVLQNDQRIGITTSGGFSPTLQRSIAFARLTLPENGELSADSLFVEIRGKQKAVTAISLPFVRNGKIVARL